MPDEVLYTARRTTIDRRSDPVRVLEEDVPLTAERMLREVRGFSREKFHALLEKWNRQVGIGLTSGLVHVYTEAPKLRKVTVTEPVLRKTAHHSYVEGYRAGRATAGYEEDPDTAWSDSGARGLLEKLINENAE